MPRKIINKLVNTEEKKRLAGNIFSLSLLQGSNYILPLLTVPYLVRVLGPEYFGLLAFANATIAYLILITDYGFNLSATSQVSIHRSDEKKINEIFSSVMIIKSFFFIISFLLMTLIVFSFDKFSQHWEVYYLTFGMVLGQLLFPVWLFQGMEQMKFITILNILAKTFFTVSIFIFVHEKADYLLVPLLTTIGFVLSGIYSLYLAKKKFNVRFSWQTKATLKFHLFHGWHVFFSKIAISLYTISTVFILGLLTNNTIVGYFAAADKIVQAAKGLYLPVSQAVFPMIGKKIQENKQEGLKFISKITWIVVPCMFLISALLFLLAEPIIILLLGSQYKQSIQLLQIMSFLPFIIASSNMLGVQTMLNLGYKQLFSRIIVTAAFLGIGLSFIFVPRFQSVGSAITMLIVELFVTITMYIFLKKKLINYG